MDKESKQMSQYINNKLDKKPNYQENKNKRFPYKKPYNKDYKKPYNKDYNKDYKKPYNKDYNKDYKKPYNDRDKYRDQEKNGNPKWKPPPKYSVEKEFQKKVQEMNNQKLSSQQQNSQNSVATPSINSQSKTPQVQLNDEQINKKYQKPEQKKEYQKNNQKDQRIQRNKSFQQDQVVFKEEEENVQKIQFQIEEQKKLLNKHIKPQYNQSVDNEKRIHEGVQGMDQCKKVNGFWDGKICWETQQEKQCSMYDDIQLMDETKTKNMSPEQKRVRIMEAKSKCNKNDKCFFNRKTDIDSYQCFDKANYFKKSKGEKDLVLPEEWNYDINDPEFQKLLYYYYHVSMNVPVMKHLSIPNEKINMCDSGNQQIFSPKFNLAQFMARIVAKTLIEAEKRGVRPKTRGLLCWWSTGAGKTPGASAIMNEYLDTNKRIVYATSVEAIRANEDTTFYNNMRLYVDRFKGLSVEEIKKRLQNRIIFKSFAQMAHLLQLEQPLKVKDVEYYKNYLDDAVLIIDEVQDLFQPIANQQKEYDAFRNFLLDVNNPLTKKLHIYLLSATPGDTTQRIVALLNILRAPGTAPIVEPNSYAVEELQQFKRQIRGMVSYYNQNTDYTRFPFKNDKNVYMIPMSEEQYKEYKDQSSKISQCEQDLETLIKQNKTDEYFKRLRRYSNSMLKWDKQNLQLIQFSSKMKTLLDVVQKHPYQKHYIYSSYYRNFSRDGGNQKWDHGVFAIGNLLTTEQEYEYLSMKDCKRIYDALKLGVVENREKTSLQGYLTKKRRYVIATSTAIGEEGKLDYIVGLFNHKDNAYGEYIQIFLASQKYNQSIDLKSLRHIHFLEPLLMRSADMQLIGRGVRSCSHAQLKFPEEWNVEVHRYFSSQPTSHEKVFDSKQFETTMGEYLVVRKQIQGNISDVLNQIKQVSDQKDADFLQDLLTEHYKQLTDIDNYYFQLIKAYQQYQMSNKENTIDVQIMFQQIQLSKKISKLETIMKQSAVDCRIMNEVFDYGVICD